MKYMTYKEFTIHILNKEYSLETDKRIQKDYYKVQEQVKYINERIDFLTYLLTNMQYSGYKINGRSYTDLTIKYDENGHDYSKLSVKECFDLQFFELYFSILSMIETLNFRKDKLLSVFIRKLIYTYKIITPELYNSKYNYDNVPKRC